MKETQNVAVFSASEERNEVTSASVVLPGGRDPFSEWPIASTLSEEMRARAFNLVLQLADKHAASTIDASGEVHLSETSTTFRLARHEDIKSICDFRCAQSIEYWDLDPTGDERNLFHAETEAFLHRTLNETMFFALVECEGEVVSMSGLEAADRLPMINMCGGAQHSATIVACYTMPQHRGRGHMGQMLSAWASMAPLLGIDTIFLESHNASMQHLAQNAGYEHVSDKYRLSLTICDEVLAQGEDTQEHLSVAS